MSEATKKFRVKEGKSFSCIENGNRVLKKAGEFVVLTEEQAAAFSDVFDTPEQLKAEVAKAQETLKQAEGTKEPAPAPAPAGDKK